MGAETAAELASLRDWGSHTEPRGDGRPHKRVTPLSLDDSGHLPLERGEYHPGPSGHPSWDCSEERSDETSYR